jgi:hypothetical protein
MDQRTCSNGFFTGIPRPPKDANYKYDERVTTTGKRRLLMCRKEDLLNLWMLPRHLKAMKNMIRPKSDQNPNHQYSCKKRRERMTMILTKKLL